MALIRWQTLPGLDAPPAGPATPFVPAADIVVGDRDLVLTMDLPGLTASDLSIEIQDGVLSVRGRRVAVPQQDGTGYAHRERRFGAFERRLQLPDGVDPDTITASMDDGVLSLLVPKPVRPAPTRIAIKPAKQPDRTRRFSLDGISAELLKSPRQRSA